MKILYIIAGVLSVLFLFSLTIGSSCGSCGKEGCPLKKKAVLYHSNQCVHCKHLMPEWLDAKRAAIDKQLPLRLEEVEAGTGTVPKDVRGFPTCEYNGKYYVGGLEIKKLLGQLVDKPSVANPLPAQVNTYTLYYANWCGYSKKILPIWEAVARGKPNFKQVEEEELSEEMSKEIDGFPIMYVRPACKDPASCAHVNNGVEKVVGYDNIKAYLEKL